MHFQINLLKLKREEIEIKPIYAGEKYAWQSKPRKNSRSRRVPAIW